MLLAHHANPNVSDCHYGTPLHIAASRGHQKCAEVLLRYGANVNATHIHDTALHFSSKRQDEAMMHLLLDHGADVYSEDSQGRTARDLVPDLGDDAVALKKYLYLWESKSLIALLPPLCRSVLLSLFHHPHPHPHQSVSPPPFCPTSLLVCLTLSL